MPTIRDPASVRVIKTAMESVAEVDRKTARYMKSGPLFGKSGNSFFKDGELSKTELTRLKAAAERALDRLEPSGLYTLLGAVTGFGSGGPHRIAENAIEVIQHSLDILGTEK